MDQRPKSLLGLQDYQIRDTRRFREGEEEIVKALHEEHIVLRSEGPMPLKIGDKFLPQSGQQDIMVNRWDQFIAVRNELVEGVWDIPARGCHN